MNAADDARMCAKRRSLRHAIVVAIIGFPGWAPGALAEDGLSFATPTQPLSPPRSVSLAWLDAGDVSYRVVLIAAGATLGVIAVNFVSGGMIMPLLAAGAAMPAGTAAAPAAASATVGALLTAQALGMGFDMVVMAAAPTAMTSVGGPVDAALRDGYTTPEGLLSAFGESASRAGSLVVATDAYLGSTVSTWLNGNEPSPTDEAARAAPTRSPANRTCRV